MFFFGIKSNKLKIGSIKTEPNQIRYGSNIVSNFYKPKNRKTEKTEPKPYRNPDWTCLLHTLLQSLLRYLQFFLS